MPRRSRLSEVQDQIRCETERKKAETSRSVDVFNKSLRPAPGLDRTGLHGWRSAESALERFCEAEQPWYAAVLVVDSLPSISLRFGSATANEKLQSFGDFIAQLLSRRDRFSAGPSTHFWGSCLVQESPRGIREDFSRPREHNQFEHTVRTASRSVLLPLTVRPGWAADGVPGKPFDPQD